MATTDKWNDPSGERKERTEWHRIVIWGKQAEIAGEYLRKGRAVYVEGSLQTREWTDRDGNKRYTTEIKAQRFQMLGGRDAGADDRAPAAAQHGQSQYEQGGGAHAMSEPQGHGYDEDDIPF